MTALSAIQIPKPSDWQAFERGSVVLWRLILGDDSVHRFGRTGQAQHGLDLTGYRNGDPARLVGIQCKCKGPGEEVAEAEFRADVERALRYEPHLTEYFFTTTAPDDAKLHTMASVVTAEQEKAGRMVIVRFWGWGTLEQRIQEHHAAALAFDPGYSAFSNVLMERLTAHDEDHRDIKASLACIEMHASRSSVATTDATTTVAAALESHLDAEIDRYRAILERGHPRTALGLLETLLASLKPEVSGRIRFRVKANIGHCHLKLGDDMRAADLLVEAVGHAPRDPKALANKVLAHLLQGLHREAFDLAVTTLRDDATNEATAGYLIQAAARLDDVTDPLADVPEPLRGTERVVQSYVDYLRIRGRRPEWWAAARDGHERFPDDDLLALYRAEADIDEIIRGKHAQTWRLTPDQRAAAKAATDSMLERWTKAKDSDFPGRPDLVALCANLTIGLVLLGDIPKAVEVVRSGLAAAPSDDALLLHAGSIALEAGDRDLAELAFKGLADTGEALLIKCQIAARLGDWKYLASLSDQPNLATLPLVERDVVDVLVTTAVIKLSPPENPVTAVRPLIASTRSSPRAAVLAAGIAQDLGLKSEGDEAYENAVAAVSEDSHIADRMTVAQYASRREDHAVVIRMLDGHIDTEEDSEELRTLAASFAHLVPPREQALEFFRSLPDALRQRDPFMSLEGVLHFNRGDLESAEDRFRAVVAMHPRKIRALLPLVQTLIRSGDMSGVRVVIARIDPTELEGDGLDRVRFAQALSMGGREAEAIALGYDAYDGNRNDPEVNLLYLNLVMSLSDKSVIPSPNIASVDTWVRIEDQNGESHAFLIGRGGDRPSEGVYCTQNPLAAAVIGKAVDENVFLPGALGAGGDSA